MQSNVIKSWKWAEQFIHKIIEPFIGKYSPLKSPGLFSRYSIFDDKQHNPRTAQISRFDFHVLRLILLACTSAAARHLIGTIERHEKLNSRWENHFAGGDSDWSNGISINPLSFEGKTSSSYLDERANFGELSQIAAFNEWKEFVETLRFTFRKSPPNVAPGCAVIFETFGSAYSLSIFPHEDRIFENPLGNRCAKLRELARLSIWMSVLNHKDENCASESDASLAVLFRELGLPALLINYLEFR